MENYVTFKGRINKISENNRIIIKNIISSFTIKGVALIISLFTMPAYIRYFDNQEVLGLWFTMISMISWILTFDLGIGNGLRNHLVSAIVKRDYDEIKGYISSSYFCIATIIIASIIIGIGAFNKVNWNNIFNIQSNIISNKVLSDTVIIIFIGILIQFLLKLITSILYALQKSAYINFINLVNSIIILIYVICAKTKSIEYNLISLAIVHVLAVNMPLIIATFLVFSKKLKGCFPSWRYFKLKYAKDVMKLGGVFFWIQIMYMIIIATNEFLITWLVDPKMVVEYQIYNKLFTLVGTFFTLALTPIWSAVTKAVNESDFKWLSKLFRVLKLLAICAVVFEFIMIPFLQILMNLWLKEQSLQVNYSYAFVFAVFGSILIWNGVISSIANGLGRLKVQGICFTLAVIIKIPLSAILVSIFGSWIGIIIANIISLSIYCIIEPISLNIYINKNLT